MRAREKIVRGWHLGTGNGADGLHVVMIHNGLMMVRG